MDLPELVMAYLAECQIERTRAYVETGRRFSELSIEALNEAWVETYRAARGREDESRESELQDLRCEFDLRGIEPHMHLVAAEADRFTEGLKQRIRECKIDPDMVEKMEAELERVRDRFTAPKN